MNVIFMKERASLLILLFTLLLPLAGRASVSEIGFWRGEGNAVDSRNSLNGVSNRLEYAPGISGQAFSFDGTGTSRITMPDSDLLKLTGSLTMEGWIWIKSFPSFQGVILFRGDHRPGYDPYTIMTKPDGRLAFEIDAANNARSSVSVEVATNRWIHFAGVLDDAAGKMKLYVNGELAAEKPVSMRPFAELDKTSNPGLGIGNHPGNFWNFPFHGLIDELSLSAGARTAEEIRTRYLATAPANHFVPHAIPTETVRNTPPTITTLVTYSSTGDAQIAFDGVSGTRYVVQASSDLVTWQTLGPAVEISTGSFSYEHPAAAESAQRFYRVVEE